MGNVCFLFADYLPTATTTDAVAWLQCTMYEELKAGVNFDIDGKNLQQGVV